MTFTKESRITNEDLAWRAEEIIKHSNIEKYELSYVNKVRGLTIYKSIEYHMIIHMTFAEHYYLAEVETLHEGADAVFDTPRGVIYCYR